MFNSTFLCNILTNLCTLGTDVRTRTYLQTCTVYPDTYRPTRFNYIHLAREISGFDAGGRG